MSIVLYCIYHSETNFIFNLALNSAADSNLRSDASEFHTFVLKNLIIDIMYSVRTLGSE